MENKKFKKSKRGNLIAMFGKKEQQEHKNKPEKFQKHFVPASYSSNFSSCKKYEFLE